MKWVVALALGGDFDEDEKIHDQIEGRPTAWLFKQPLIRNRLFYFVAPFQTVINESKPRVPPIDPTKSRHPIQARKGVRTRFSLQSDPCLETRWIGVIPTLKGHESYERAQWAPNRFISDKD